TDAGVHALAQVAHLDVATPLPPETLRRRINDELPADINILAAAQVPHRFHARHDAIARRYLYQLARRRTAFATAYVWWAEEPRSTRVLVDRVELVEEGELILVALQGSHFLWKMVRRIVGVLVEIGRGGLPAEAAAGLLDEDSDAPARLTAPPSGLFLEKVFYKGDS